MQNPLTIVIFGATGDLYQNKLASALCNLHSKGLLGESFTVMGFARKPLSDQEFQNFTRDAILSKDSSLNKENLQGKLDDFLKHFKYVQGDLENLESFRNLSMELGREDEKLNACSNKLFYLAVPPNLYATIFQNICDAGLTIPCVPGMENETAWTRVLVEKPFGKNMEEAEHLDEMLGKLFDESQIFRIDHYLAKETMQDILSFRFTDGKLENIWNKENIERVKIIFHETNTIENRGALYDGLGILRDVGQNHMLQMLALVAMEKPGSMKIEDIRNARKALLEKIILLSESSGKIVRGQYAGYLEEKNVKPNSDTETFFRLTLGVDSNRWSSVPFELEAGKALDKAEVYIKVYFKSGESHNFLISSAGSYDAYEKVLYDCISGDQTIFTTTPEIMAEWKITTDIIKAWQNIPIILYQKGSKAEDIK